MGVFVPDRTAPPDPGAKPLHFVAPTARERRDQAVSRLQFGLLGIAGMLLLVGLANIILDNAQPSEDGPAAATAASQAAAKVDPTQAQGGPANDPLADIGVVPDLPADEGSTAADAMAVAPAASPNPSPLAAPR